MTARLDSVTFDVREPLVVARFWAGLLAREVVPDQDGALVPGDETQVGLRFVPSAIGSPAPSRLHLHLGTSSQGDQDRTVEHALELGGRHLDVGQGADEGFTVLADPADHAFCVIEPHNRFLAGCGRLAEVTCEGSRDVGLFWHRALGWPLVWDQDGETAVQSPAGGTKISWGGPPVPAKHGRNHQRLALTADDLDVERDRLRALGASLLSEDDTHLELTDPDGTELTVSRTESIGDHRRVTGTLRR